MQHHDAGRLAEAEATYRRVLALAPNRPDVLVLLGALAHGGGRLDAAVAAYRKAAAHGPRYAPAWINLANALEEQGRFDDALAAHRAALAIEDRPEIRTRFARCVAKAARLPADPAFRALLTRAIAEAWARPADLALAAIRLIRADPTMGEAIDRAIAPGPDAQARLAPATLAALSSHALLLTLLESAQVCEPALERFLTRARVALLDAADDPGYAAAQALAFPCALARQCLLNDYVFAVTREEAARAATLRDALASDLASGAPIAPARLAILAAYLPLDSLPSAARLLDRVWPKPIAILLAQQVVNPRVERELLETIPAWTPVAREASLRVRRQYEESPYPRWVRSPAGERLPLAAHLQRIFPRVAFDPPAPDGAIDVLVAGCGTGQEPVDLARRLAGARIAAIDLSRASLAYAARMTRELGIENVEYAQADILELGSLGRDFDLISSVGVLHHLADPQAGWRALAALLRPGGFMQVGLYSEIGRADLAPVRALIAERGYEPTAEGIRACRGEILESGRYPRVALLRDFYGMNECRDLLFHVEEHRFDLAGIGRMAAALGLELVGLMVEPALLRQFRARFPEDRSDADLDRWHAFETGHPEAFAGMYLFWVRKPIAA